MYDFVPTEVERVFTGTSGTSGSIVAPPSYPAGNYSLDATSYVFVLENTAIGGSVELVVNDWDVHPLTWITVSCIGACIYLCDKHSIW